MDPVLSAEVASVQTDLWIFFGLMVAFFALLKLMPVLHGERGGAASAAAGAIVDTFKIGAESLGSS